MKKIAAIGLLVLLLYNTFGLTFAIFFFENDFKVASSAVTNDEWTVVKSYLPQIPYSENWENSEGIEGLLQKDGNFYNATNVLHQNDTLYVTLKTNQNARDSFFELVGKMDSLTNSDRGTSGNAENKALKLLSSLFNIYTLDTNTFEFFQCDYRNLALIGYPVLNEIIYTSHEINLSSPPPEFVVFDFFPILS